MNWKTCLMMKWNIKMQKKELNVKKCKLFLIWNFVFIKFSFLSDFEQEAGYPKQNERFLDLSVRGYCTDLYGQVHDIEKDIIIGIK